MADLYIIHKDEYTFSNNQLGREYAKKIADVWRGEGLIIGVLEELSTIDAVPVRHGTWKVWADKHGMTQLVRIACSECGKDMMLSKVNIPNYCPNCGAKMREVQP